MFERLRLLLWRHQRLAAYLYLALILAFLGCLLWYRYRVPHGLDTAVAVALRSVAYQGTFERVDQVRADIEAGRLGLAEQRLDRFIAEHRHVQPAQLATHAVTEAHELLADVYRRTGRMRRRIEVLEAMILRTPLNHRLWHLKGNACRDVRDMAEAARCLREAFKLTLNNPEVVDSYIAVLDDQNAYEDILWVADHYARAKRRGAPRAEVKVGVARSSLERRGLAWAGIPVEHGIFDRNVSLAGLARGERKVLSLPREMFVGWGSPSGPLYVQLKFENVYEELRIDALRYRRKAGEPEEVAVGEDKIAYLHRPHSGASFYAEVQTDLDARELEALEIVYSCPEHVLSAQTHRAIAKARVNVQAKRGS